MTFAALGLVDPLLRALDTLAYQTPTPAQTQAIPAEQVHESFRAYGQCLPLRTYAIYGGDRRGGRFAAPKPAIRSQAR